jgi:hypothetical protein
MDSKLASVLGFRALDNDLATYVCCKPHLDSSEDVSIIAVHVDNMLMTANSDAELDMLNAELDEVFKMTQKDDSCLLGMDVVHDFSAGTTTFLH